MASLGARAARTESNNPERAAGFFRHEASRPAAPRLRQTCSAARPADLQRAPLNEITRASVPATMPSELLNKRGTCESQLVPTKAVTRGSCAAKSRTLYLDDAKDRRAAAPVFYWDVLRGNVATRGDLPRVISNAIGVLRSEFKSLREAGTPAGGLAGAIVARFEQDGTSPDALLDLAEQTASGKAFELLLYLESAAPDVTPRFLSEANKDTFDSLARLAGSNSSRFSVFATRVFQIATAKASCAWRSNVSLETFNESWAFILDRVNSLILHFMRVHLGPNGAGRTRASMVASDFELVRSSFDCYPASFARQPTAKSTLLAALVANDEVVKRYAHSFLLEAAEKHKDARPFICAVLSADHGNALKVGTHPKNLETDYVVLTLNTLRVAVEEKELDCPAFFSSQLLFWNINFHRQRATTCINEAIEVLAFMLVCNPRVRDISRAFTRVHRSTSISICPPPSDEFWVTYDQQRLI